MPARVTGYLTKDNRFFKSKERATYEDAVSVLRFALAAHRVDSTKLITICEADKNVHKAFTDYLEAYRCLPIPEKHKTDDESGSEEVNPV